MAPFRSRYEAADINSVLDEAEGVDADGYRPATLADAEGLVEAVVHTDFADDDEARAHFYGADDADLADAFRSDLRLHFAGPAGAPDHDLPPAPEQDLQDELPSYAEWLGDDWLAAEEEHAHFAATGDLRRLQDIEDAERAAGWDPTP